MIPFPLKALVFVVAFEVANWITMGGCRTLMPRPCNPHVIASCEP